MSAMSSTTDPTSPARIRQLGAQELKSMLDDRVPLELLDVRTEAERAIARIEGARHLDEAEVERHQGFRSQAAAQHFVAQGFTNVCNLSGGIDAWSAVIDPSVRRY